MAMERRAESLNIDIAESLISLYPQLNETPSVSSLIDILALAGNAHVNRHIFRRLSVCSVVLLITIRNNDREFDQAIMNSLNNEIEGILDSIKQKLSLWTSRDEMWQIACQDHISYEVLLCIQSIMRLTSVIAPSSDSDPDWMFHYDRSCVIDKIAALNYLANPDTIPYLLFGCSDALAVRLMSVMQDGLLYFSETSLQRRCLAWSLLELQIQRNMLLPNLILRLGEVKHIEIKKSYKEYDIWEGEYLMHAPCIIKEFRTIPSGKKALEIFLSEVEKWRSLFKIDKGAHILPCWGVYIGINNNIALVHPQLEHGNIIEYLKRHPGADRKAMIKHIALGLKIMHEQSPPVIHGDLRAANIYINDQEQPVMTNLNLTEAVNDIPDIRHFAGPVCLDPIRNVSPELLNSKNCDASVTTASDVYALGMTMLEIFTEELPFKHIGDGTYTRNIAKLVNTVARGTIPERPVGGVYVERGLDDGMWELLLRCWAADPEKRPSVDELISELSD